MPRHRLLLPIYPGSGVAVVRHRLSVHSALPRHADDELEKLLGPSVRFGPGALIAEVGDATGQITILQDGFACRTTLLPDGRRQIHAVFIPGDAADAEATLLKVRPDNIETLTQCRAWLAPKRRFADLLVSQPRLAQAFAREAAISAQVAREWVVNVGSRDALERISHLICELYARMDAVGLVTDGLFPLPLTQQDIADAQGLSSVHVNRVLQDLRTRGLIQTEGVHLRVLDLPALRALALFDPLYLHLQKAA